MRGHHPAHLRDVRAPAQLPFLVSMLLLTGCAGSSAFQRGVELENAGRIEDAVLAFRSVAETSGGEATRAQQRMMLLEEKLAASRLPAANLALQEGRLEEAIDACAELLRLAPDVQEVQTFFGAVREQTLRQVQKELTEGAPLKGAALFNRLRTGAVGDDARMEGLARDVRRLRETLLSRIETLESNQWLGNALLARMAFDRLGQDGQGTSASTRQALEHWQQLHRLPVTLDVSGKSSQRDAISTAVAALPFKSPSLYYAPGGKRSDGLQLELMDLDDVLNASSENGFAIRSVQAGTKRGPNPEIKRTQEKLDGLEASIMQLGERIDSLNTQLTTLRAGVEKSPLTAELTRVEREHHLRSQEYVALQESMAGLPREVDLIQYQDIRFPQEVFRRTVTFNARYKATSTRAGLPLKVELPLQGKAETSCGVHPAYPQYGVAAGVLKFEVNDTELRGRALEALARQVIETTERLLNDSLILQRKTAREQERAQQAEEALEIWLRVATMSPGEVPDEVRQALGQRGLSELEPLRTPPTTR
ncbi:MAG: hypothetical protein ACKO6N_29435 [Myxococcota bacterium]